MKSPFQKHLLRLALLVASASLFAPPHAAAAPRANAAWGTVPSPNAGFGPNELFDVDVLSANDIWAVGNFGDSLSPSPQVQHWDGSNWQIVPLPGANKGDLIGVSAVNTNDVWFVGGAADTGKAFIYHWNGTAITQSTNPSPGSFNRLYAVVALAANNVWAVGEYASGGVSMTLIEHWNGSTWTVVPSPTSPGEYTKLLGVSAVNANDIWAVGEAGSETYTLHWNGSSWLKVASPQNAFSSFQAVSATAAGEVWAVGDQSGGNLTARWTGSVWQVISSPAPGGFFNQLSGVVVLSASDVWAAGYYDVSGNFKTLALHWDGTQWTQVASVSPDPSYDTFNGIDADSSSNIWAVGRGVGTLTERLNGAAFAVVPSANAGSVGNDLKSISAASSNDIWAVGNAGGDSLTMHWDGTGWTLVPTPDLELDAPFEGVKAIAANDVWAVGSTGGPSSLDSSTLTEHWNGSAWVVVASPNPGRGFADKLYDVDAAASNEVWAVGDHAAPNGYLAATILHWNGAIWADVPNSCGGTLRGITVISLNDIWAVGATTCHYDGVTWTQFSIPPTGGTITLQDVSAVASNDVWAVGQSVFCDAFNCYFSPYAIHWDGSQWKQTPVPPTATLSGVQAIASNNVVAVGTFSLGTEIIRWNGRSWQTVPSPDPESGGGLNEITLAGKKLWSVGSFFTRENEIKTLVVNSPSDTQGAITGATGVSGATVSWFGAMNGSTTTDIFGNYAAAGLPAGTYTFIATADGCDPDIATVVIVAGKTARQNFSIDCGG